MHVPFRVFTKNHQFQPIHGDICPSWTLARESLFCFTFSEEILLRRQGEKRASHAFSHACGHLSISRVSPDWLRKKSRLLVVSWTYVKWNMFSPDYPFPRRFRRFSVNGKRPEQNHWFCYSVFFSHWTWLKKGTFSLLCSLLSYSIIIITKLQLEPNPFIKLHTLQQFYKYTFDNLIRLTWRWGRNISCLKTSPRVWMSCYDILKVNNNIGHSTNI